MKHRLLAPAALLLALVGVACGKGSAEPGLALLEPSSVAVFRGATRTKNAGALHPYVAIANGGKDELVLVDAVDDKPVLAPIWIKALEVPTPEVRPALLVSGSLHDVAADGVTPLPDLLAVTSAGSSRINLVGTWDLDTQVLTGARYQVDLSADILDLVAIPVPPSGCTRSVTGAPQTICAPTPGQVRLVAALAGRRIAVVTLARSTDGSNGVEVVGAPVIQTLPFQPVQLAVEGVDPRIDGEPPPTLPSDPSLVDPFPFVDPRRVYVATQDPIPVAGGSVLGVAELDVGADATAGAWSWRGLDARAPTIAVAAWRLKERAYCDGSPARDALAVLDNSTAFDFSETSGTPNRVVDRVYAALDVAHCGTGSAVDCGVVVLDPATGEIPPDPANGYMPYMAPIAVPGTVTRITVAPAPMNGPTDVDVGDRPQYAAPYLRIAPGTGQRTTTAVAALATSTGRVYYADLARWAIPNDTSILSSTTTDTAVTAITTLMVIDSGQAFGVWDQRTSDPKQVYGSTSGVTMVTVTPGFTPTDTYYAVYQAVLPGLSVRRVDLGDNGDGRLWMAVQSHLAGGTGLTEVARLYSPELGVHRDDIAVLDPRGITGCPVDDPATTDVNEALIEARVAEFLIPDAARPGGAVILAKDPSGKWDACYDAILVAAAAGPLEDRLVDVRAGGVMVWSLGGGYLGRTSIVSSPAGWQDPESDPNSARYEGYRLIYRYEGGPTEDELSCPLIPWPADPSTVDCRDDACRATCEQLALARKARRMYHLSDSCGTNTTCLDVWKPAWAPSRYPFPRANGAVLAFKLAHLADTNAPTAAIPRGLALQINTRSGIAPSSRGPVSVGIAQVLPSSIVTFDRSVIAGKENDGYRFYVSFPSGFVLDFSPSLAPNQTVTLH